LKKHNTLPWLTGWRILDLSLLLPGPFASWRLAQMGAEVVKIEPPTGDGAAQLGVATDSADAAPSWFYRLLNHGKTVVSLDLKSAAGRDALLAEVAKSDAVLEGFRPGTLARLGVAPEALWAVNPQLVIVSITGFASDGPLAPYAGHDLTYQAWAGLLQPHGNASGCAEAPAWSNVQIADLFAGAMHAALALVAAVHHARATGKGCHIEVPMCETLLASAPFALAEAIQPPAQRGLLLGAVPCYAVYRCADGRYLAVGALETKFWRRFCEALDHPQWVPHQFDRSGETHRAVAAVIGSEPQATWRERLVPLDCCVAPVLSVEEAKAFFATRFDPLNHFPHFPLRAHSCAS